ncbi:type II toxin-antitoxin system RelE/ParE family toxin [Roseomonas sp. F4]
MAARLWVIAVEWTRLALADLDDIGARTAANRPDGEAGRLLARLVAAAEALREFPERGRPGRIPGTRELVLPGTPFLLPYRLKDQRIEILAVLHGARAWPPRAPD